MDAELAVWALGMLKPHSFWTFQIVVGLRLRVLAMLANRLLQVVGGLEGFRRFAALRVAWRGRRVWRLQAVLLADGVKDAAEDLLVLVRLQRVQRHKVRLQGRRLLMDIRGRRLRRRNTA